MKLRPLTGRSWTACSLTRELSVEVSVCSSGDSPVTMNGLGHTAHREPPIDPRAVAAREHHAGGLGLEALHFDLHGVRADRQQRKEVIARVAGDRRSEVASAHVLERDCGAWQHRAAGVGDTADDVGGGLRERRRRERQAT